MYIYIYIYIYIHIVSRRNRCISSATTLPCSRARPSPEGLRAQRATLLPYSTPNLPADIVGFRGFDSSIILNLRGGILRPIGNFPEVLSQAMLAGTMLEGKLGVPCQPVSHLCEIDCFPSLKKRSKATSNPWQRARQYVIVYHIILYDIIV